MKPEVFESTEQAIRGRARAHQRYYREDENGKKIRVPGVTTILGMRAKPFLVRWANNLGLEGIDSSSYTREAADIGTLAHEYTQQLLGGPDPHEQGFTAEQIGDAKNSIEPFMNWMAKHEFETHGIEVQVASNKFRYGGTVDWYGIFDGSHAVLDFKTSKQITWDHRAQITAYVQAMRENGYQVDRAIVVKIPRNPGQIVRDHEMDRPEMKILWKQFLACRDLYELDKDLKKLGGEEFSD